MEKRQVVLQDKYLLEKGNEVICVDNFFTGNKRKDSGNGIKTISVQPNERVQNT